MTNHVFKDLMSLGNYNYSVWKVVKKNSPFLLPRWLSGREYFCQFRRCRRHGFDSFPSFSFTFSFFFLLLFSAILGYLTFLLSDELWSQFFKSSLPIQNVTYFSINDIFYVFHKILELTPERCWIFLFNFILSYFKTFSLMGSFSWHFENELCLYTRKRFLSQFLPQIYLFGLKFSVICFWSF